jgi:hypothetical protein
LVPRLSRGEIRTFSFSKVNPAFGGLAAELFILDKSVPNRMVVCVMDNDENVIHQCESIALE